MKKLLIIPIIGFVLFYTYSLSQTLSGQVVSIADGDTITMLDSSKKQVKIRLYGIDCPEKRQPSVSCQEIYIEANGSVACRSNTLRHS